MPTIASTDVPQDATGALDAKQLCFEALSDAYRLLKARLIGGGTALQERTELLDVLEAIVIALTLHEERGKE